MTTDGDESTVVLHLKLTAEELADWLEYCREHDYNPHERASEVLMDEACR